jgi:hypothetical protein
MFGIIILVKHLFKTANMVEGLNLSSKYAPDCAYETCSKGKLKVKDIHDGLLSKPIECFDIVYIDTTGKAPIATKGGALYVHLFLDRKSSFTHIFFMKLKSQVPETIDFYCEYVEVQFGTKVKRIHSYRVKEEEYGNSTKIYLKRGIEHSMTVANTPAHNRVERKIGSISNLTRYMLLHSKLPYSFWGEAFAYATRIENYLSTSSIEESISPWQALYKTKPDISKFHIFGYRAQMLIEGKHLKKFDSRTKEVIYLDPNLDSVSGHRVWDPNTRYISVSRSVCFFENTFTPLPFITGSPFSFSVDSILYVSNESDFDEEFLVRNSENENNVLQIPDNAVKPRITFRIGNEVLNPEQSENENNVSQKSVEELKPQITIRVGNEIINPKSDNQKISSSTISSSLPSSSSSTNSNQSNSNSNSPDIQTEITERRSVRNKSRRGERQLLWYNRNIYLTKTAAFGCASFYKTKGHSPLYNKQTCTVIHHTTHSTTHSILTKLQMSHKDLVFKHGDDYGIWKLRATGHLAAKDLYEVDLDFDGWVKKNSSILKECTKGEVIGKYEES